MNNNKTTAIAVGLVVVVAGLLAFDTLLTNKTPATISYVNNATGFQTNPTTPSILTDTTVEGFGVERPEEPLPQPVVKQVKDVQVDLTRIIEVYGEIGENAVGAAIEIGKLNSQSSAPIFLLLDSPGGGVLSGARLISAMQSSKAPVYTVCMNMCASMAFMIHQFGVKRYALDRAILMSHPASVGSRGDVDRIASFIGTIKRYTNKLEAEVAKRMKLDFTAYKQKIQNEYWVDAEDALKDNVVDQLINISVDASSMSSGISDMFRKSLRAKELPKSKIPEHDIIWIYRGVK